MLHKQEVRNQIKEYSDTIPATPLLITTAGIRIRPMQSHTANMVMKGINETKWIIMYIWTGR